eukprot:TRINITY_DN17090_c0_g1_i3.p2 TRINITY_DN17090_c0_g1~~TRINITY_DN17090_c0_g1_i3.p2  ORF type:complete len:124 (-),score=33.80 TRINITY_DN17090_c0_g1_i3:74-445(-)
MKRRPPRSTQGVSSAASDVYKRQAYINPEIQCYYPASMFASAQIVLKLWPKIQLLAQFAEEKQQLSPKCKFNNQYLLSLIHISEPTRPLYISYAVFCLKKKKKKKQKSMLSQNNKQQLKDIGA